MKISKLTEGEATVTPDISAQIGTQVARKENAQDIIVNMLVPLIEGKAVEFPLGKPQIYSEWEQSLPQQSMESVRSLMMVRRAPRETIVVPVEININSAFQQNARQAIESIAFAKKRVDRKSFPGWCANESRSIPGYDPRRDGALSISGNTSLADIYFLKDIQEQKDIREQFNASTSLVDLIKKEAFSWPPGFLSRPTLFPNLIVSMFGSEGILEEYIVTRKPDFSGLDVGSSSDLRAFTDNGWASLHSDITCLVIEPTLRMNLFLNLPHDEFTRVKIINLKMESN